MPCMQLRRIWGFGVMMEADEPEWVLEDSLGTLTPRQEAARSFSSAAAQASRCLPPSRE